MEKLARIILNNAQTSYDGGVIGNILQNVKILNNTNLKKEVMPYVMSLRLSGGYGAGLIFGTLWIFVLISVMIFFCYLHYNRPRDFNRNRIFTRAKLLKKGKKNVFSHVVFFQLFAITAIVIPVFLLLCLSFTNVAYLSHSISTPANNYEPNKTEEVRSLLPALKKSLFKVRGFLAKFASNARINTASTVEDIVIATKEMQNRSSTNFNKILMGRLGVLETFKFGDEMTQIVVLFFEHSIALLQAKADYEAIHEELFPKSMNPDTGLFHLVGLIRDSFSQLPNCDNACQEVSSFFSKTFSPTNDFPNTDFASSFLFVMKQRNETQQSVKAKSSRGREQMAARMAETKRKMDSLVDIGETVRNATGSTWTKMEKQMQGVVAKLDNVTLALTSDRTSKAATCYARILVLVLTVPLLLSVIVIALAIMLVCGGARNTRLRITMYGSLSLLAFALLIAMITFLVGGKMETELCRYLRTEQRVIITTNDTNLALDRHINKFLRVTLKQLPKSESPLPSPNNALYGLVHRCRRNEPILAAIDAIRSLNTSALSKPETSMKIVAIGRMLLIESLNSSDPKKMMPPDMQDSLKQASQMDMFKKIDFDASVAKIPFSPITEKRGNTTAPVLVNMFIDRVDKYLSIYAPLFKNQTKRSVLEIEYKKLLPMFERFLVITDKTRALFTDIRHIPQIAPVVKNLQKSLQAMVSLMSDKDKLLSIANRYYDDIIVKSTPANSAKIMAKFGPIMMGKLGHCRPLFEAYQAAIDTTCDIVVSRMNTYWLYLGTIVMLLTVFLAPVFVMIVRTPLIADKTASIDTEPKKIAITDGENKNAVTIPLVDVATEDEAEQSKMML